MSPHDPFAGSGARQSAPTIIAKPQAGRTILETPQSPHPHRELDEGAALDLENAPSLNPLVAAAAPLLATAARLRTMATHRDPQGLRESLLDALERFDRSAHARGMAHEHVVGGSYVLCTLLDEAIMSTPWSRISGWYGNGLLAQVHGDVMGGDTVFELLSALKDDVQRNRPLLELIYVALSLGLKGKYAQPADGRQQLEALREDLSQRLQRSRGGFEKGLSPHWKPAAVAGRRLRDGIPVWVVASGAALGLGLVFFAMQLAVNARSSAVEERLARLDVPSYTPAPATPVATALPVPAPVPRLASFLAPEMERGEVTVQDLPDRSIVTVQGDLFNVASAEVTPRYRNVLRRIALALRDTPGDVLVVGHTDTQPLHASLRYPSNFQLSQARAETVKDLLQEAVPAQRLRTEGRGDRQPLDPGNTEHAHRTNRRVEIVLQVPESAR